MKNLFIALILFSLVSSCAIHKGLISSSPISRNVKYTDIAFGVSQTGRVLGIGGLSCDALVFKAKSNLIKGRPLNPNEEYVNFTVDFKNSYFFLYQKTKVTMTADIVKYSNDTSGSCYTEEYKKKLAGFTYSQSFFSIGDSVIDNDLKKGKIIAFENAKTARIIFKTADSSIKTKKVSIRNIYSTSKSYNGYKTGDLYKRVLWAYGTENDLEGKIIGIGLYSMIVYFEKDVKSSKFFKIQKVKY